MAKDVWKSDFSKSHQLKGRNDVEKRTNYVRSQGGNEWDVKGFDRFMDYRTARDKMYGESNAKAQKDWNASHEESLAKQREKEKKQAEAKLKKMEQERKQKKAEQDRKKKQQQIEKNGLKENSFLNDMLNMGKVGLKSALTHKPPVLDSIKLAKQYADKGVRPNDATKELSRGITRTANTFGFGAIKEMSKDDPYYQKEVFNERKGGGKAADFTYDALGYLVPASKAYGALNASKAGKALTNYGAKSIGKRLVSEGVKGAAIGNVISNAEVGARELINPNDYNWKDNAKHIGFGTGMGAVADPLLYGAGKGIAKGFESAANRTMRNLIPNSKTVEQTLLNTAKNNKADMISQIGNRNPVNVLDEVLQNTPTNRNYLPNISPKVEPTLTVPEVGKPLNISEPIPVPKVKQTNPSTTQTPSINEPVILQTVKTSKNINDMSNEELQSVYDNLTKKHDKLLLTENKGASETVYNNQLEAVKNDINKVERFIKGKQVETPPVKVNEQQPIVHEQTIKQETPMQSLERPVNLPPKDGERQFYNTVSNSEKASNEFVDAIKNLDRSYQKVSDKEMVDFANGLINRDVEEAFQFVKNADSLDKRHNTVGLRLIDEFQKRGEIERAVDMAQLLAEEGTKAGQRLQSFTIYNKLSPEGVLIVAQRKVSKLNAALPTNKKITLTDEIANDLTVAAESIQKLTGQQEVGKSVISLLEKAKKGNVLSDEELKSVSSFVEDVKKYVGDVDPKTKPPKVKAPKDVRTRDKVVNFMDKREELARQELKKIFGRANSMPVDAFYHLSVIGASKIAKGTVKFADFSEQMLQEFGETVRPYMKQIYNKAVENFNLSAEKMTSKRLTEAEKIVNKAITDKNLSQAQADELLNLVKRVVNTAGDSKFEASMELQVVLNKLEQPTFAQMLSSAQTQAMLLNPLTMARNIIGNEVFYRVDRVSKLVAVPLDAITSKMTGNQRTIAFNTGQFHWQTYFNPLKDYWKGMKLGAKAGWKGVNPLGLNTAYDIKSQSFSSEAQNLNWAKKALVSKFNPLHWTEKVLGVTLRSFDTAGYMRAYNQTLREQATLKAMNEGLKGKALREAAERYFREADENMVAIADEYGKFATFQDSTGLARGLTKGKEKLNEVSTFVLSGGLGKTKEFGLGDLIIKFPKTPANLIMRAIDYSPAGLLRSASLIKDYLKLGKNPLNAREAQLAFGRSLVGTTGFSLFGFILADKGVLTSAGDSDYEVRELERMAGKQPNSVNISAVKRFVSSGFNLKELDMQTNDTFVSYDWMQPVSIAISLGTGVNQAYKESENPTFTDRVVGASDSAANTIINMSVLSGINRLVSGPPGEGWSEKIAGALTNTGGSFIPTLSNQFRKKNDNTARSTYGPTFKDKFVNATINRIPGVERQLPPSYNTLGNEKELYQNDTNNFLNVFLNPSFVSKYQPSPEAKFLLDYMNKTGDKSLVPRIPDKSLDGVALTGQQYADLQRIMGQEVQKGVKDLIPRFKGSNDTEAIGKELEDLLTDAGKKARSDVRSRMVSQTQLDEARRKYGLDPDTIYKRLEKGKTLKWSLTTPE